MTDQYDERQEELSTIAAIFPELVTDPNDANAASLELPCAPATAIKVHFSTTAPLPSPPNSDDGKEMDAVTDVHRLDHLPPLHITLVLPQGYPEHVAPQVALSTNPAWLPLDKLRQLAEEVESLWEDYGRCQILFSYIDHLQQAIENGFHLDDAGLSLPSTLKSALLDFDAKTKKSVFNAQTFDCGICLEPKKGSECYRLARCDHVFCRACLQESYGNYISEGDIVRIRCLDPTCGKNKAKKRKVNKTLHPRELLDMFIPEPTVRRYVDMKRKKRLEADKTTIYCPRSWCQAPARSAKYPPIPDDLRDYPDSDDSSSDTENMIETPGRKSPASPTSDRLCICSNPACTLAFCRICHSGWHGEFARCWPRDASELTEEEQASYDYIRTHTSPCPYCNTPVQKTMGCNHMTCFQCQTHFCYLCGSWLDGDNPYPHFTRKGPCYQKLWELEEGDEGGENVFRGGRFWEIEAQRVAEEADRAEAERMQDEENQREVLMDAPEDEIVIPVDQPIRLNGGQILPEAPEPPEPQVNLRPDFYDDDDDADDQFDWDVPGPALWGPFERRQAGRPRRGNLNLPVLEGGAVGRGRNAIRNAWHNPVAAQRRGGARNGGRGRAVAVAAPAAGMRQPAPAAAPGHLVRADMPAQAQQPPLNDNIAAALREFVELAVNDREEEWDSDELGDEDDGRWHMAAHGPRVRHREPGPAAH